MKDRGLQVCKLARKLYYEVAGFKLSSDCWTTDVKSTIHIAGLCEDQIALSKTSDSFHIGLLFSV